MVMNITMSMCIVLSAVLAVAIVAKADIAFATPLSPKVHLEEGIKALRSGDSQGALMHLSVADQGLSSSSSDQSAKMHLDEGIKAIKASDTQGAMMHLQAADQALGGSG